MASKIINSRADLESIAGTPEYHEFMAALRGSLWRFERNDAERRFDVVTDTATIEKFGFELADFPEASPPPAPDWFPLPEEENSLSPVRFRYMLAANGWEQIWADVEEWAQQNDRATYAKLYAQQGAREYRLSVTLAFVEAVRAIIDQLHPGADLAEATIRAAWEAAKEAEI